jgi:ribosomal-protein-alanine N-acetyltransferase
MQAACFPDDPWGEEAFARVLGLSGSFGLVVWHGDAPLGFVLARDLGEESEILSIGVLPEYRRRGAGRVLLDALVAEVPRRGGHSVVLEVAEANAAARQLYRSLGFTQVGRRPRYYRTRHGIDDGLILRRVL